YDFQERHLAVAGKQAVGEAGLLRPRTSTVDHVHAAMPFVLDNPVRIVADRRIRASFDKRPVDFLDCTGTKLLGHPGRRFGSTGQKDDAGYGSVQPAHDAKVNISWLLILLFDVILG